MKSPKCNNCRETQMADLALGGERPREMWENGNIDIAPISPLPRGNWAVSRYVV